MSLRPLTLTHRTPPVSTPFPTALASASASLRLLLPLFLGLVLSATTQGGDWQRFLGPAADGTSAETGLIDEWPAKGPRILFSKPVGTGYSAPSTLGRRLVLHHRLGQEEIVECFDKTSGISLWSYRSPTSYVDPYGYNNGPRCTPLLTTNRCYTFGVEGRLLCLDLETGKKIWERDTATDWTVPQAFFGVGSTPILEGQHLIVMVGGQPNSGVVAFDRETGRTVWENVGGKTWTGIPMKGWPGERTVVWQEWEKQASYASLVGATFHGQRRILALMRQGLVMLNPTNGAVDDSFWFRSRANDSVNAANPVVLGTNILISAAYYKVGSVLLGVAPGTFKFTEHWRNTVLEIHWTTPILRDGFLYAFSGRNEPDARFRCVEMTTGKLMWDRDESWPPHSAQQPGVFGRGAAILADGKLIVLGEGGLLGLFKPDTTKPVELARHQIPDLKYPCWAAPILSDKVVYLRSESRLVAVDFAR